jgi:hypothetical protein
LQTWYLWPHITLHVCLNYPACKSHPCCALLCLDNSVLLWPLWLGHISCTYLTNGIVFGKKCIWRKMCFLFFSLQLFLKPLSNPRRIQRDIITTHVCFHTKCLLFFNKTEFGQQISVRTDRHRHNLANNNAGRGKQIDHGY